MSQTVRQTLIVIFMIQSNKYYATDINCILKAVFGSVLIGLQNQNPKCDTLQLYIRYLFFIFWVMFIRLLSSYSYLNHSTWINEMWNSHEDHLVGSTILMCLEEFIKIISWLMWSDDMWQKNYDSNWSFYFIHLDEFQKT